MHVNKDSAISDDLVTFARTVSLDTMSLASLGDDGSDEDEDMCAGGCMCAYGQLMKWENKPTSYVIMCFADNDPSGSLVSRSSASPAGEESGEVGTQDSSHYVFTDVNIKLNVRKVCDVMHDCP